MTSGARSHILKGRVWKFGDYVKVTHFLSGKYDPIGHDPTKSSKHVLEDTNPTFVQAVRAGDLIVAGKHFGQGKHNLNVIHAMAHLGIAGFIAESFDSVFHRACINDGTPAFAFKEIPSKISDGDVIEIDLRTGHLKNFTTNATIQDRPAPPLLLAIVEAGGLAPYTIQRVRGEEFARHG